MRSRIQPCDGDTRHGTAGGYANLACRCASCRAAHNAYMKRWRRRRGVVPRDQWLAAARETGQHGARARYRKGCRCADCTEAERAYRAEYRARQTANGSGR